jgi:hypothetical protein
MRYLTPTIMLSLLNTKGRSERTYKAGTLVTTPRHPYTYTLTERPGTNLDPEFKPAVLGRL